MAWLSVLASFGLTATAIAATTSTAPVLSVSTAAPSSAGQPVLDRFVSFSIEFSSFPDFAGNKSAPNTFSNNLLDVLGSFQGQKPIIRVGGNTQDYATYNPDLKVATNGTVTNSSNDYPTILQIGKSYFESFGTWPDTQFSYGFDFAINNQTGQETLNATARLACNALQGGKLFSYEMGNEADLYKTSNQGIKRPKDWNEQDYVREWHANTSTVESIVSKACPHESVRWMAPSFAGTKNGLDPVRAFNDGLDSRKNIKVISSHNYMAGATSPGVTLQGTLMNHTNIVNVIKAQVNISQLLSKYGIPFTLGETNSLYNEGKPGLSNSFGAALWGVDFNLWCASQGIRRVHMHQGTSYRYQAWQPVATGATSIGTKAPFYGNVAVAAILGNCAKGETSVANLAFPSDHPTDAAYGIYKDGRLARIAVINMAEYNYTVPTSGGRSSVQYRFAVSGAKSTRIPVQRLFANGSDAITGIAWDGISYNYELNRGKPQRLHNITVGEHVDVKNGMVSVMVPYSAVAVLNFE